MKQIFYHMHHLSSSLFSGKVRVLSYFILLTFFISGFVACKSTKEVVKKPAPSDVKLLEKLIYGNGSFNTMSSKVDFKLMPKEGVSVGVKGSIKMRRDSCIILSVQFVGIELVRCLIKKDSLYMVSRLHKTYSTESLQNGNYSQYLNLELLQSLLSNRVFIPGEKKPLAKDMNKFEWHTQKEGDYFRWTKDSFNLDFYVNENRQYTRFKASGAQFKETISVVYSQFEDTPTGSFPNSLEFLTEGGSQNYHLQISYLKPTFDSSADFQFEIPSKFKKVTTVDMIKRFQSML
jgi:Domain of unknown function (DUF4292)